MVIGNEKCDAVKELLHFREIENSLSLSTMHARCCFKTISLTETRSTEVLEVGTDHCSELHYFYCAQRLLTRLVFAINFDAVQNGLV